MVKKSPTVPYATMMDERRRELRRLFAQALPRSGPVVCEIGCGHGHFLAAYAKAHPERWCVGIDLVRDRIDRAVRKRVRAKLGNVHFIQTEAGLFLETLPDECLFSHIFLLFPDPWPKLRHHKNRIIQPRVLDLLAAHSAEDCRLHFRTDFEPYFKDASAAIDQHPRWCAVEEAWPFEHETVFQSRAPSYQSLIARLQS